MSAELFASREAAGIALATRLLAGGTHCDAVVGIPNGGIVVAQSVATVLGAPLLLCPVARILAPETGEVAIGAVYGWRPDSMVDSTVCRALGLSEAAVSSALATARGKVVDQAARMSRDCFEQAIPARSVIVVDDGIATGASMLASLRVVSMFQPNAVVAAAPVVSCYGYQAVSESAQELVYLHFSIESEFQASAYYRDFLI